MIDSSTYKNILDSTIVPQGLSAEEQNSRLLTLNQYVQKNLPAKLYRYRKCSERQLDEFYNDKISFAPGTEMNDDFEAMTMFHMKELRSQFEISIQQAKSKEFDQGIEEAATVIANAANKSNTEILSQAHSSPIVNKKQFDRILSKSSADFDVNIEEISKAIQSQIRFSCFCDDITSDIMWGHYADSSKGFAVEYRFSSNKITVTDNQTKVNICGTLYPVFYASERPDGTEFISNMYFDTKLKTAIAKGKKYSTNLTRQFVPQLDVFMPKKIVLHKSSEWSYEKEWRMFFDNDNNSISNEKYPFLKYAPSGIYLGRRISSLDQKILTELANEKGIPVYKMYIDNDSKDYRLKYDRVYKKLDN